MHFECRITACSTQVQATNIRLKISVLELSWRRPHPLANAHEHVTCLVLPVSPYYSLHARSLSHAPALQPSCLLTPGARLSISIALPPQYRACLPCPPTALRLLPHPPPGPLAESDQIRHTSEQWSVDLYMRRPMLSSSDTTSRTTAFPLTRHTASHSRIGAEFRDDKFAAELATTNKFAAVLTITFAELALQSTLQPLPFRLHLDFFGSQHSAAAGVPSSAVASVSVSPGTAR